MNELPFERAAVIDLAAVRHNVRSLLDRLQPSEPDAQTPRPRLMAVVKADAYGHGAEPVARAALAAGADRLGVAHVREALELRQAGLTAPILAWLHTPDTPFAEAIAADVTLGVSGWDLDAVAGAVRALRDAGDGQARARVHLKLDTGLGRHGCMPADRPAFCARAAELEQAGLVEVDGVFSHLGVADDPERAAETEAQREEFLRGVDDAERALGHGLIRHLANTPATLFRPDTHLDMVRVGLGLYGLSPFEGVPAARFGLRPVMSLRTSLANVKRVPAGQGVSYGFRHRTQAATVLGLVPVGYADGVPRLADDAPLHVAGRPCTVAGRIAMDQFVVDLGPDASEAPGAPVELFGPESGITADAWAAAAGTINYELVTRIGARVPRVHVDTEAGGGNDAVDGHGSAASPVREVRFQLDGVEQTQAFAGRLAGLLRAGDVLVLTGDLGAGKTTFTQGLGRGLGVREGIISPTFVLSRIHPSLEGGPDLVHVDAYRLGSAEELLDTGLEDTVAGSVTVVEWGRGMAERLAGHPEDPRASWLDLHLARSNGGQGEQHEGPHGGDGLVFDFSDEDGATTDETRTAVLRAYGPRWAQEPLDDLVWSSAGALRPH